MNTDDYTLLWRQLISNVTILFKTSYYAGTEILKIDNYEIKFLRQPSDRPIRLRSMENLRRALLIETEDKLTKE